jgi:ATP-dependent 26S proteasome regulatory subunit
MLYVGPPDVATREAIFRVQLKRMPCANDVNITELCQWVSNVLIVKYVLIACIDGRLFRCRSGRIMSRSSIGSDGRRH